MPYGAALEIAAPSAAVDPLAPWIGARTSPERALAATFLVSLGGLSGLFHAAAVVLALAASLLPLPFLPAACAPVKRLAVAPPEPVVMSIIEVEPPPELVEEVPPPPEPPVEDVPAAAKGAKAKQARLEREVAAIGMLALIGSAEPASGVFGRLDSDFEGNVLGGLIGDQIGDSFGAGGLGLSGVGAGGGIADLGTGGGGGAIGIGGLGTIGKGGGGGTGEGYGYGLGGLGASGSVRVDVIDTDLAADVVRRVLLTRRSALAACAEQLPADVTVRVRDGKVTSVDGAPPCVARALRDAAVAGTGYAAVHIERR